MRSFIFPLIYILFSNATTVCLTKKSFIKSLPVTLMLIPFPLFFSGIIFSTFKIGIIINIIYALLSIPLIIKNIKEFKNNYFTYGLIAFIIVYVFIFIYDLNRSLSAWDDVSHWGLMVKEMFRLDNFYIVDASTLLVHKDYPPIIQLYELFWLKCCGSFKESYLLRSLHTFNISLLLPFLNLDKLLKKINSETLNECFITYIKTTLYTVIVLLIILLFDTHGVLNTLYVDYPLSIITSYILVSILLEKNKTSNYMLIKLSILFSFIILTKQVSLAFYLMLLFFYIINIIKSKNINILQVIKIVLLLIMIPILMLVVWNKYTNEFNITRQFMISDIKIHELSNIITNKNNKKHIIVEKYKNAIFNDSISHSKFIKLTYFSSYIIYSILTLIIFLILKKIKDREYIKYYLTVTIGYIGYGVMILILYLFCFKDEGYVLASFDRYMVTYLLILFITLTCIFINHIEINNNIEKNIKYYIIFILMLLISIKSDELYRLLPIVRPRSIHYLHNMTDYIIKNTEEDSKIFILSQNVPYVEIQIYVNYYINPRKCNFEYFNLPINCKNCEKEYKIKEYLSNYDYIYIYGITPLVYEKYSYLKDLKTQQLYKIKNIDNSIKFEEIN